MNSSTPHPESSFDIRWNYGGLISLKNPNDPIETDYIWPGETLGDVVIRTRKPGGDWQEEVAFNSGDIRAVVLPTKADPLEVTFQYRGASQGVRSIQNISLDVTFRRGEQDLLWEICLKNETDAPLEIGDIALPLPFNKEFVSDNQANYTRVVGRHAFISGHGSFIFWERPSGQGPYLLMTPLPGTKLEYYEARNRDRQGIHVPYWVYLHSACKGAGETHGTWRQPHTSATLSPKGQAGDSLRYGFKFQWAKDYDGVRDALYAEGLFDVQVVPGMTVPTDLQALVAIRTRQTDHILEPEYPEKTTLEKLDSPQSGVSLYRVRFQKLGENLITVRYGTGTARDQYMTLEFFVTEPVETLVKKRTRFLVEKQQHRNPKRWYNGLFSVWDMRTAELRGPDNTDGFDYWWGYVLACDDTALPKAPFIAAKNLYYPDAKEIAAVEYYLENFVWGKLQRTDTEEPLPYTIYGVPNWFENRYNEWGFQKDADAFGGVHRDVGFHYKGKGQEHVWRNFDYPHIVMLYFHMYQIAKKYPHLVHYLDARGYLQRACGTAQAYFKIQNYQPGWGYWSYTLGIYNEMLIVDLIQALKAEGMPAEADWLTGEWEKKVKYFIYDDPYPFDSEYPFDTTAFESSHAIAKYALANSLQPDENLWYNADQKVWYSHPVIRREDAEAFLEKQIEANIALRGWLEPAYYLLGSDYRGGECTHYALSYMSQMGGWAILDYAINYARDPFPYLRLGYASYLSSWALMNTGTPESNYGYWYPGPQNDGATGWAVTPEKYGPMWIRQNNSRGAWPYDGEIELGYSGGLRMAATILADDPLFGLVAYGGDVKETADDWEVIPRDGLRRRFYLVTQSCRLQITCDWDGFAAGEAIRIRKDLSQIELSLENRAQVGHTLELSLSGLPEGEYEVESKSGSAVVHATESEIKIPVMMQEGDGQPVVIRMVK